MTKLIRLFSNKFEILSGKEKCKQFCGTNKMLKTKLEGRRRVPNTTTNYQLYSLNFEILF